MTTLRNKRKLAAVTRETQEEKPRNGQSRNTSVPRINEEDITQVFEEIEGRITKKLSQEFNRIESRISDALSKLDEFLLNQQITTHSETVPGTFRNTNAENQETNEDNSQSDPHPEAGIFCGQNAQNSDLEDCCDRCNFWNCSRWSPPFTDYPLNWSRPNNTGVLCPRVSQARIMCFCTYQSWLHISILFTLREGPTSSLKSAKRCREENKRTVQFTITYQVFRNIELKAWPLSHSKSKNPRPSE